MLKKFALLLCFILMQANFASANEYEKYGLHKIGSASLTWLFWDVYDIALLADSESYEKASQFGLKLSYKMDLKGDDIAERSVQEMRLQNMATEVQLATWFNQLKEIFPDVKQGDSITGIKTADGEAVFYFNGKETGRIKDREFAPVFFNIWLGEKTSEPALRAKLLQNQLARR